MNWRRLKAAVYPIFLGLLLAPPANAAGPPPVISTQPQDSAVILGNTATFTVAASSATTLSYQWYKVGLLGLDSLLTGETRTNFVISAVGLLDPGQFYVKVSNAGGTVQSRSATLSLSLLGNTAPTATNDDYSTLEDTRLTIPAPGVLANDYDANGEPLTALLMTNGTSGSMTLATNGAFNFLPPTNFSGAVSFTYVVSDRNSAVAEQNSSGGNSQEVRKDQTGTQSFQHGVAGDPAYFINQVVLYLSRKTGGNGTFNVSIGTAVNGGFIAQSSRSISAASITNTSQGTSFQAYTVVYNTPVGPFAAGTTYYLNLGNDTGEKVFVEYPNSDAYARGSYYDNGVNLNKDMRFQIYAPTLSNPATVTLNISPVNDAPIAVNDTASTPEDTSVTINVLANDSDVEGSPLTLTGTSATLGTAVISGTNVIFTPAANFNGMTSFDYYVSDGGLVSTGHVSVAVNAVNDAPVAVDDNAATLEDTSVTINVLANDTDVEGAPLIITGISSINGTALVSGASIIFTPATNFNGTTSFDYYVSDGALMSTGHVTVTVSPVNDAPIAANDTYTTAEDTVLTVPGLTPLAVLPAAPIGILANDTDVENDALSAQLVSNVAHGSLVLNPDGSFTYTPNADYNGTDTFTYQAWDGSAASALATVTINVTPVADSPQLTSQKMTSNGFQFQVAGSGSTTYVILATSNLKDWTPIATNFAASGSLTFTDTDSLNNRIRFYRVEAR